MPLNHVVLASGAVVAVSVAMATMIAVYESPEFRRYTEDVRRRLAMVFDSFNENGAGNTPFRPPRFNRPEDADGFILSRRGNGNGNNNGEEVDADEESRRKQREELLYWNAVRLEKEKEKQSQSQSRSWGSADDSGEGVFDEKRDADSPRPGPRHRGSSFDDFLRPDEHGEKGSYVFNSGVDIGNGAGLRHRGAKSAAPPAVAAAAAATAVLSSGNPFVDLDDSSANARQLPSANLDIASDIYSATTPDRDERPVLVLTPTLSPIDTPATLVDLSSTSPTAPSAPEPFELHQATLSRPVPVPVSEPEAPLAAPQDERHEVFASIQAWAHDSSRDFYSPLPVTPVAPISEPELISEGGFSSDFSDAGELTPLEGMSVAGSAEDVGNHFNHTGNDGAGVQELVWAHPASEGRAFDVMSESEGMLTPASWSEVGSVISESEAFPMRR